MDMGMGVMEVYCKFYPDIFSQADIRFLVKHHNPQVRQTLYPQIKPHVTSSSAPKLRTPWKANAFKMW
jgi:hypothetical protein